MLLGDEVLDGKLNDFNDVKDVVIFNLLDHFMIFSILVQK